MWERFPQRMRRAVTAALEEAGRRGCESAGPEDLLLAVTRDPECGARLVLGIAGIAIEPLAAALEPHLRPGDAPPRQRAGSLSPSAMHVLDVAVGEADRRGDEHVGTEHVLLALSHLNGNAASDALRGYGLTPQRAEAALRARVSQDMPRRPAAAATPATAASRLMRLLCRPVKALGKYPALAWRLFVGLSLGHPGFVSNPYPLYRKLRSRRPVRRDPLAPVWVVTRYEDVMTVLRDPRFRKDPFAAERLPRLAREQLRVPIGERARSSVETISMLFLDPPEHTRVRSIFTRAFSPRRIESLRPRIEQICEERLDRVQSQHRMDLIADLAYPLPVTVIAELLGFPPEDYPRLKKWSDEMAEVLALNPTVAAQVRAAEAREELREYFDGVVEHLRRAPGDNLLSALLAPGTEQLSREELFSNSVLLLAAGHETTTHLIGNGVLALLRHPDQLRDLRAHPELIENAVEELLRYDPPVQWTSRVAGEPIELGGQTIERGQLVLGSLGSANRDESVFRDPDRLDIRRSENRHLSFGTGIHFCLGASLARMEAHIAIGMLVHRFPSLRLARQRLHRRKGLTFRGVHALQLEF